MTTFCLLVAQTATYILTFVVGMTLPVAATRMASADWAGTVPNMVMLLATLAGSQMAVRMRRSLTWRRLFLIAGSVAVAGGAVAVAALRLSSFAGLTVAAAVYGIAAGLLMWLRFARSPGEGPKAPVFMALMTGTGMVAAIAAPELVSGMAGRGAAALAGVHAVAMGAGAAIMLAALGIIAPAAPRDGRAAAAAPDDGRAVRRAFLPPLFAAGASFFAMGIAMAGTPLMMSICGFSLGSVALAYRYHLVAMFLPSLLALPIASMADSRTMMRLGLAINLVAMIGGAVGLQEVHFFWVMALNGAGWSIALTGASARLAELAARHPGTGWLAGFNAACLLANAAGTLVAGVAIAALGWPATLGVGAAALAGVGLAAFATAPRHLPIHAGKEPTP